MLEFLVKRLADEIEVYISRDGSLLDFRVTDEEIAKHKAHQRNLGKKYMKAKMKECERKSKNWRTRLFGDLF